MTLAIALIAGGAGGLCFTAFVILAFGGAFIEETDRKSFRPIEPSNDVVGDVANLTSLILFHHGEDTAR